MSRDSRQSPRDQRGQTARGGVPPGRLVARPRRVARTGLPQRSVVAGEPAATAAEVAPLRAQVLRFALTLPGVAVGDSRIDTDAAGLFVRVARDDGAAVEMREFAAVRNRPRWSLSVLLPIEATAELQRLGWGRPRSPGGAERLLLELVRPRYDADVGPLQRVVAAAHRAAADPQGRNR